MTESEALPKELPGERSPREIHQRWFDDAKNRVNFALGSFYTFLGGAYIALSLTPVERISEAVGKGTVTAIQEHLLKTGITIAPVVTHLIETGFRHPIETATIASFVAAGCFYGATIMGPVADFVESRSIE